MSPNPFGLLKLAVRPDKWVHRKAAKSPPRQEHWKLPYPGTYEHRPGRGWYLVAFDEDVDEASLPAHVRKYKPTRLPLQVTHCKLLARYMLPDEFNERRRFERLKDASGRTATHGFFRIDDRATPAKSDKEHALYVQCWDADGKFVDGPYYRYYLDDKSNRMCRLISDEELRRGKAERQSRRDKWERTPSSITYTNASEPGSSCTSTRGNSFSGPVVRVSTSSTADASLKTASTAVTTPGALPSPVGEQVLSPADLRGKLMTELGRA